MAKDTEIETTGENLPAERELSLSRIKLRQRLAQDMLGNSDAMERIGDEIATAETVDDLLQAGGVIHAEDILNTALDIRGFVLRPSDEKYVADSDGKSESFAVMDVVVVDSNPRGFGTGEVLIVTCGGYNVQNALVRYGELVGETDGLFKRPLRCAIKEAGRALRLYKPETTTIAVEAQ